MKKNDWILILTTLIFSLLIWVIYSQLIQKEGDYVVVSVDGEIVYEFSLDEEIDMEIEGVNNGSNHLLIKGGKASIVDATCPDKLCVHQKSISKDKETIVCLPNKVVIEIRASKEKEYDAVVN